MPRSLSGAGLHTSTYRAAPRLRLRALLNSNRFALGGAVLFALLVPELFHPHMAARFSFAEYIYPVEIGMIATGIALVLAHVALRRTASQPFVDSKTMVLPAFVLAFASVFTATTLLFRVYSLYHPVTGFLAGIAWYLTLAVLAPRVHRYRVALAAGAQPDAELLATHIQWVPLARPRLPQSVSGIVFDSEQHQSPPWDRLYARAVVRGVPVFDLAQLREMATGRVRLRERPELVFGQIRPDKAYLRIKRTIDTALAIAALVIIGPVIAVTALLIRLESPGSPIFRQPRVGYKGRIFTCFKLRSMRSDIAGPLYTTERDPRITRIGRFIRATRLDELPQIFNILKGEMSWIGPRPEALRLARAYQREIPYYAYRHMVRPGISGWAAVHQGNVALTEAATRKLEFDFYYLKHCSLWLDFIIFLLTIRTVVTGFGSR